MGEIMKGVVLARAWLHSSTQHPVRKPVFKRACFAGCLPAALVVACLHSAAAQVSASKTQTSAEFSATAVSHPAVQDVPEGQLSCRGRSSDDRPTLRCTVRFDAPVDVTSVTVVDSTNKSLQWTPVFHPFDPTEDSTAIYVLIDRRVARQAERDLSEIFGRAQGRQQVAVSAFANELTKILPFTTDRAAVSTIFSRISLGGSASELLRHSLEATRQLAPVSAPRKILLIASSGKSDDTAYTIEDVIKLAKEADVRIVALGYVDQPSDTPNLQILERMSNSTRGFYYRFDPKKTLPQDVRGTILTRFSAGGTLDATAPSTLMPPSLDIKLQHPKNLTSNFVVNLPATVPIVIKPPPDGYLAALYRQLSNPLILAAAILAMVLIAVAMILLVRQSRRRRESELPLARAPLATVDEVRENLSAQREVIGLPEPSVGLAASPAPELAQVAEPAMQAASEGPVIAWLEFNSIPGRVGVRKKHVTIGREADNDIVTDPNEDTVSRHHAAISVNNNGRFQISNRSREYRHTPNPIWINDKEMEHAELSDGDRVKLGTGSYGFVFVEIH